MATTADAAVQSNKPIQIASVYVGDLDPTVNEPQLVELFKPFGTIINVRVCRDMITNRSLGYGYVNFDSAPDAEKAIETLNFTRVGDKCVRLMWQQRDPALRYSGNGNVFVKNLDKDVDSKSLNDIFKKFGSVLSCKVMSDEEGNSRGYGFVHFKDEKSAKDAIENMNGKPDHANAEKQALYVANFIRRNARLAALVANFTNVYIKQVIPSVDKDLIEKFFSKFGGITSSATCKDKNGRVFAFCNFEKHDDAVKAIEAMHDSHIEGISAPGEKLYVQRAQPRSERLIALRQKYMQTQSLGNNLYVRNFDPECTDENLHELFKEYGEIKSCRVMTDANGVSRGFGFVSFTDADQANAALREMNGRMLNGKPLIVNIAQRRDQRYTMLRMQFQQRLQMMMRQMHQQVPYVAGQQRAPRGRGRAQGHQQQAASSPVPAAAPVSATPTLSPGQAPETPPLPPITLHDLESMSAEEKRSALGDRLYVKVYDTTPDNCAKVTGMLLEKDPKDVLMMLNNQALLVNNITEALCVLRDSETRQ
ncbi:polyadenylate-binding protein [Angomonas deanei]|uniref:Polyadenylate-binding protein n=1 Tax=Angomonas deanei TaxID=59799 RepID=A0A7G2CC43_9TRYP|nr:polyadenylate-binding protein [Angomonas deanei]CAD2216517.1 RNA recognition motif. (a.k.a. RRM, RBD, or RNP domain)/Poly-adenylate binding protein, unique domain containing protein, putative [Angomonas deanei]|eukprot:EPY43131.1 polyadenylate-binding protein [Angomonas deanei]